MGSHQMALPQRPAGRRYYHGRGCCNSRCNKAASVADIDCLGSSIRRGRLFCD
jgi:hypothetical protein